MFPKTSFFLVICGHPISRPKEYEGTKLMVFQIVIIVVWWVNLFIK